MKRSILSILILSMLLCTVSELADAQEKSILVGTWKGSFLIPGEGEDAFTLVIKLKEGELAGQITDELGYCDEAALMDFNWDAGKFSFDFYIVDGDTIKIQGKLEGTTISGSWEHPGVDSGTFAAEKK